MNTLGSLDSPVMIILGSLNSHVVNTPGSLDSPVMNTPGSRLLSEFEKASEQVFQKLLVTIDQASKDFSLY
jgi:hypothetical protein